MRRATGLLLLLGLLAAGPARAQQEPVCEASSDTPRTAEEVIAAIDHHRCSAGSRLTVVMKVAGQAIMLRMSGICRDGTVHAERREATAESQEPEFTCLIASR